MASIFTKIIQQEIPSYKIAEDEKFYAFLDIRPLEKGHTLIVPKKEIDYIFDMDDDFLAEMHIFSKKIALAIDHVIDCKRVGLAVVGLEVAHAHIHLIPLHEDAIEFSKSRLEIEAKEMEELSIAIGSRVIL